MARSLRVAIGQHSDKGVKETNQDFHGAMIPQEPGLTLKGIAVGIADGISSSSVSRVASESAVKAFLTDYYCTSDAWTVKTSVHRVLAASNSWLHAETRRSQWAYERDKGYVCTFSGLVLKSATAHLFHVGDSRVHRLVGQSLEQLTEDHRLVVSSEQSYLTRALGMDRDVEIDYRTLPLAQGDVFVLTTDGVHDHVARGSSSRPSPRMATISTMRRAASSPRRSPKAVSTISPSRSSESTTCPKATRSK